jgi:hypothetical protein
VLADNRIALNAGWDTEMLSLELADLSTIGVDLSILGFSSKELAAALSSAAGGLTDENEVPPAADVAVSKSGDIWKLGPHRVACGDSTDAGLVQALLVVLSQKVAAVAAENQIIEGIQILARGGPDESQACRRQ